MLQALKMDLRQCTLFSVAVNSILVLGNGYLSLCMRKYAYFVYDIICYIVVESLSQVRRRLNGVEKERLEAATRSNAEVWI